MKKLEHYRKAVVAAVASAAGVWAVITAADLSTREGLAAAAVGVANVLLVYFVPNAAPKK